MKIYLKTILFLIILFNTTIFGSNLIKITLLERIPQFITWPLHQKEFIIGIYKNIDLKNQMVKLYKNKKIHNLDIKVVNINNPEDERINNINLLYFTRESSKDVDSIFRKIKKDPILIITEFPNDVYQGMHIGFYYKNKKIKFLINKKALEKARLKASYKILKSSKIIEVEK
jgi:hypothetical protein